jgi:molecular chaperone HtpG
MPSSRTTASACRSRKPSNLGTIAKSGTRDFMAQTVGDQKTTQLIGQFGVGFTGFYHDRITVEPPPGSPTAQGVRWSSDGTGESEVPTRAERAPASLLHLKDDAQDYLNACSKASSTNIRTIFRCPS